MVILQQWKWKQNFEIHVLVLYVGYGNYAGNSNLNVLGSLPNEGSNVSFSNELRVLVSLHPNDLTLKPILLFHRC